MTNTNAINALDSVISNGYSSWGRIPYYYNDYNVAGNDPTCKHTTWTDTHVTTSKQPYVNRYCDSCGYRKLFIKYAKYCRTTKKGGRK